MARPGPEPDAKAYYGPLYTQILFDGTAPEVYPGATPLPHIQNARDWEMLLVARCR